MCQSIAPDNTDVTYPVMLRRFHELQQEEKELEQIDMPELEWPNIQEFDMFEPAPDDEQLAWEIFIAHMMALTSVCPYNWRPKQLLQRFRNLNVYPVTPRTLSAIRTSIDDYFTDRVDEHAHDVQQFIQDSLQRTDFALWQAYGVFFTGS